MTNLDLLLRELRTACLKYAAATDATFLAGLVVGADVLSKERDRIRDLEMGRAVSNPTDDAPPEGAPG